MDKLEACPKCQSPCVVETFSGQSIDGVVTLLMCSNDHPHGGWCDQPAYLAADDWNAATLPVPDERAAVVSWLRSHDNGYPESSGYGHAADAIERGDHLSDSHPTPDAV